MTNNVLDVTVKACYTINIEKMSMKGVGNVESGRVQDSFLECLLITRCPG